MKVNPPFPLLPNKPLQSNYDNDTDHQIALLNSTLHWLDNNRIYFYVKSHHHMQTHHKRYIVMALHEIISYAEAKYEIPAHFSSKSNVET